MTHYQALISIVGNYLPLLNDLDNRSKEDPAANGMYSLYIKKEIIVIVLSLVDILAVQSCFTTAMQSAQIELSDVKLLLSSVEINLENMVTTLNDVVDGYRNLPDSNVMSILSKVDLFIEQLEVSGRHFIKNKGAKTGRTFNWMIKQVIKLLRSLITNQAARYPCVKILDSLATLFTPRDMPFKTKPSFATYGNEALKVVFEHFQELDANGSDQYIIKDYVAFCCEWSTFKAEVATRKLKEGLLSLKSLAGMFGNTTDSVQRVYL